MVPTPTPDRKPFRVHLTGYGPFMQYRDNPSWLAIAPLGGTTLTSPPLPLLSGISAHHSGQERAIELSVEMIPVLYSAVLAMVPPLHEGRGEEEPYDIILHLGVAGPGGVKLEQRGRRWGYTKPDADGLLSDQETRGKRREGDEGPRGVPGKEWDGLGEGEEEELRTLVRCDTVTKYVAEQGVRIRESDEAGLYLCEFIYFCSLASARRQSRKTGLPEVPVLFVHVPPFYEPYSLEEMTHAIKLVVWGIVNEGGLA